MAETSVVAGVAAATETLRGLARSLVEYTSDFVWFADTGGVVFHANPAAHEALGALVADGADAFTLFTVASRTVVETELKPRIAVGGRWEGDLTARSPHGTIPLSVVATALPGAMAIVARDLRGRERIETTTRHDATHDRLTGLRNRDGLAAAAEVALAQGRAAALLIHIDDLDVVNLISGPQAGDIVVRQLADRLGGCLRDDDIAARLDGNKFVVLLPGHSVPDAVSVARRVHEALSADHRWLGQVHQLSISIGVADGPSRSTLADLLQRADIAVRDARASLPAGGITAYDEEKHDARAGMAQLRLDLADAVGASQLGLVYQPLVSLADGVMYGVEALLRWDHPTNGPISPDVFVPMLEDGALIHMAGAWALDEALRQLTVWDIAAPGNELIMNVNVSGHQVGPGLVDIVTDALDRHRLAPQRLTLELTESVLVEDPITSIEVLGELRRRGVGIAVDDFGTGYSSLATLHQLPADVLKLDRAFIRDLDGNGGVLVKLMCQIAETLGMATVAEGVEEPAQAAALRRLGCDRGQGFLWARPLPPAKVLDHHQHHR